MQRRHAVRRIQQTLAGLAVWLGMGVAAQAALLPEDQLQLADGLYVRGLYELALSEYLTLSRQAPDFAQADVVLYRIGECHRRLNRPGPASRFYQRVLTEFPDSGWRQRAAFRAAESLLQMDQAADAFQAFEDWLATYGAEAEQAAAAQYYRGLAAAALDRVSDAETAYRTVLEVYAASPFAAYAAMELATQLQEQGGDDEQVRALYARAATQPPTPTLGAEAVYRLAVRASEAGAVEEAAEAYERLLSEFSDTARAQAAWLPAAWAYLEADRTEAALALAAEALDVATAADRVDWLYVQANAQRQAGDASAAAATYDRLVAEYPEHALTSVAAYERALLAFQQGAFEAAIAQAETLTVDAALQPDVYWLLAESHAGLGQDDAARRYYEQVVEADPDGARAADALYRWAGLVKDAGEYEVAAGLFRRLAQDYAADELAASGWFGAALSMGLAGDYDQAIADYDALLDAHGEAAVAEEARYQRALALLQAGERDAAEAALEDFVGRHAEGAFAALAWYRLGLLRETAEDDAGAAAAWRAALTQAEGAWQARTQYRLAVVLHRLERSDEAADLLQGLLAESGEESSAEALAESVTEPVPPALLEWLAVYRLEAGAFAEAEMAARALQVVGSDDAGWRQISAALLGRSLVGLDQPDAAEAAFAASIAESARTRDGAEAAYYLAGLQRQKGDNAAAVRYYEQAAAWAASDELVDVRARSYFGLGELAEAAEKPDEAARYYLSVSLLFEDAVLTPAALEAAARMLGAAGRVDEQRAVLEELAQRAAEQE
jgi:tetratricopeptide (TPR) repeat protein